MSSASPPTTSTARRLLQRLAIAGGGMARARQIEKDLTRLRVAPNLPPGDAARERVRFVDVRAQLLDAARGRGMNLGWLCADRHVADGRGDRAALVFLDRAGDGSADHASAATYQALADASSRFANVLRSLDVERGATVASLLGRSRPLVEAALGTWKAHAVFAPLFSAFGPEPLSTRLSLGRVKALLTTPSLYARKVGAVRSALPALRHILLIDDEGCATVDPGALRDIPGAVDLAAALTRQPSTFDVGVTDDEEPAVLHFTSGTTGKPKGAVHVHGAGVVHAATGRLVLDLHDDDLFWCTADPGWVTGTSYGILAPLLCGVTSIVDEADFDAERWYRVLSEHRVTVWYTAPTAIRLLMRAGTELPKGYNLSALRFAGSVGEPLNPEAIWWSLDNLGVPFHDNWWQTETGGIMIANVVVDPIRPGSMGRPVPGVEAAIVRRRNPDDVRAGVDVVGDDVDGELALRAGWPSMFRGYLGDDARYRSCFADGWYLTGDLARRDADGYYWFVGRADDVIKTSGHLVGPFEVESALMEHAAIAEAAVVGIPDVVAGNVLKAFVVLKAGQVWSESLRLDVLGSARARLGPVVAPRDVVAVAELPRTRSGKILRRLLRARELGLPEGDLSMLEGRGP
jgi:acetyl-CoA synthetase